MFPRQLVPLFACCPGSPFGNFCSEASDEGIDGSFELEFEVPEKVQTGLFVGDCFVYTTHSMRLNYVVGGKVTTLHHLGAFYRCAFVVLALRSRSRWLFVIFADRPMYLLGFLPKENRLYLIDKEFAIISFTLQMSVLEYQTAIVRGEDEVAAAVLQSIPEDSLQTVAKFLESQGRKELALDLATDLDFKFELAVQLGRLEVAYDIAMRKHASGVEVTSKWRQLSDLALGECNMDMAEECMVKSGDLGGLVLLYSSMGKQDGIAATARKAAAEGKNNIAFMCFFLCGMTAECVHLLCTTARVPEAAFFARTYAPSEIARVLSAWKQELVSREQPKIAEALADPAQYGNLFPDFELGILAEQLIAAQQARPASDCPFVQPVRQSLDFHIIRS